MHAGASERGLVTAFLFGNFLIGTGVMLGPGLLAVIAHDFAVSVPQAALVITVAATAMCVGSPVLATLTSRIDRRAVLTASLLLYAVGHGVSALAPNLTSLVLLRAITLLGAAVFTPQAAATLGLVLTPERRAGAITTIFLGWSMASVLGSPLGAWLGAHLGWRLTSALFGGLCLVGVIWVWRVVPAGLHGVALSRDAWLRVARHPALVLILAVTAASATGQFTTFAYIAPYVGYVIDNAPTTLSLALALYGFSGVIGNVWATRRIAVYGAAANVTVSLWSMTAGMLLLAAVGGGWIAFAIAAVAWGGGTFANNSSQQARLASASPELAGASIALNTSMIYLGQALGSIIGGAMISVAGYRWLPAVGALVLLVALYVSRCASLRNRH